MDLGWNPRERDRCFAKLSPRATPTDVLEKASMAVKAAEEINSFILHLRPMPIVVYGDGDW